MDISKRGDRLTDSRQNILVFSCAYRLVHIMETETINISDLFKSIKLPGINP